MEEEKRNILSLKKGEVAQVIALTDSCYSSKLMTLGILPESKVRLVRKSPLGDSLYIQIDNHYIAVRKSEAVNILID